MKKLLLLFLLTFTTISYSQTTLANKLKITANITDNTASKVNVQDATGLINTIPKLDLIDVLEYASAINLPITGVSSKIYVTIDNKKLYRWNGTIYQELASTNILGKENIENKQNDLTPDGTGTKYPTVDAVNTKVSNIDNTSDANKPVSTATQTALNLKSPIASPTFTGVPAAPTATAGTNTTQLATTAFVTTAVTNVVVADASTTVKGKIKLAGDLAGTADLPTVPALAFKEPTIAAGTTAQYYRGDKTFQTLDKTAVGLSNVDNTSDANKPVSTATQTGLNTKENVANKNAVNGYAGVGSDGKIPSSLLPSITITDTFIVTSQAAQVALAAETGDVAIRTDINKTYILKGTNPALFSDWAELLTPTSAVTTVFGRNGAVTAQTGDYTTAQVTETTNNKYQSDNQDLYNDATSSIQTQLNGKAPSTGGTGYIQNQNASAQSANMWISGIGQFTTRIKFNNTNQLLGDGYMFGTNVNDFGIRNDVGKILFSADGLGTPQFTLNTSGLAEFASSVTATSFNSTLGSNFATSSGNVGIGETSPARKLSITSADSEQLVLSSTNSTSNLAGLFLNPANTTFSSFIGGTGNDIVAYTHGAEKLRILDNGNVLINTTTDNGIANNKLQVNGTISATGGTTANQVVVKSQLDAVRPYKVYTALLTQTGTSAPTAIVLENTLGGTIVWTRDSAGIYYGTLSGAFSSNKTVCFISGTVLNVHFNCYQNSTSSVTATSTNTSGEGVDTAILGASIEIRVYN